VLNTIEIKDEIEAFKGFGKETTILEFPDPFTKIPVYVNEFWTSKQRAAHSLHEISYRACFKPQLPRFFIERLTHPGDVVYDPFMGRGTTILESALLGRVPMGCDVNPISTIITLPRLNPPSISEISERLKKIDLDRKIQVWEDLLVFYHPNTLRGITNLRVYLLNRAKSEKLDPVDAWIRMVATNRLTGHSRGFFSVYTLPPNQAVSIDSQRRINYARQQVPPDRVVREIIIRKSRSLLRDFDSAQIEKLRSVAANPLLITGSCDDTNQIRDNSVTLVVTSPPFLDTVDYRTDNWLRCWFNGIDSAKINIWHLKKIEEWQSGMNSVFKELRRVLVPGGYVAFEVGEVRSGKLMLETIVAPAAVRAGLDPVMVIVNDQVFTKTSNCWGVSNLRKGTNTNRIVLLRKH
jgi:DNA modification methylase